jgi:hypothetical protein
VLIDEAQAVSFALGQQASRIFDNVVARAHGL